LEQPTRAPHAETDPIALEELERICYIEAHDHTPSISAAIYVAIQSSAIELTAWAHARPAGFERDRR
jgi:hypothetical protein